MSRQKYIFSRKQKTVLYFNSASAIENPLQKRLQNHVWRRLFVLKAFLSDIRIFSPKLLKVPT